MAALVMASTCIATFLPAPPLLHPHLLATPPALRPALHAGRRAPQPLAFAPEDDLSVAEIKKLLKSRGVEHNDAFEKRELVERLLTSSPSTSPNELPSTLLPSEAQRVEVFERVSPAVAFIQTSIVQSVFGTRTELPLGAGSGFVWDDEGHIITNYHVVAGDPQGGMPRKAKGGRPLPRRIMVSLQGLEGDKIEARVVGTEPDKDLAVLKIDPTALPPRLPLRPLEIGSSADVRVGQDCLAVGNPFGLDYTLTRGIVSALGREVAGAGGRPIQDCIQTDAAINPGNSGGPLLDSRGKLLGVNTMIYSPNGMGGNVGIGFAVPVDTVRRVVNQILKYGPNARPSIGASLLDDGSRAQYSRSLRRKLEGALIAEVVPGSPADAVGLQASERSFGGVALGDMITAVDGKPITKNEDLLCALEEAEQGQSLRLTVMRACDPQRVEEVDITPVARKALLELQ